MDFTRQPVLETIITPREGFKLVVRSSKGNSQEEYFVEAVEIVTFGSATFLRSLEKPKCFLLPVSDYEILEVRETRVVLKHAGTAKSIKIGTTKETLKVNKPAAKEEVINEEREPVEPKQDKKRERRRKSRRRTRSDSSLEETNAPHEGPEEPLDLPMPGFKSPEVEAQTKERVSRLFPAPATLIRDTIARYRESDSFKEAFYPEQNPQEDQETQEQGLQDLHDQEQHQSELPHEFQVEAYHEQESLWDFGPEEPHKDKE